MKTKAGNRAVKLFIVNHIIEPGYPKIPLYLRTIRHPITKKEIVDPGFWGLVGGGIDKGESPLETVLRELREEWDSKAPLFNFAYVGEVTALISEDIDPHTIFRAEDRGFYGDIKLKEGRGIAYFEPAEIISPEFRFPDYFKRFFGEHREAILNYRGEPNIITPPF